MDGAKQKQTAKQSWVMTLLRYWLLGMVIFLISIPLLRLEGNTLYALALASLCGFPVLYIALTGFLIPIMRRQFRTAAQRTAVTVGLAVLAVAFLAILPFVFPFIAFVAIAWFWLGANASGSSSGATKTCPVCSGSGVMHGGETCRRCGGSGVA